ncbi:MAG TPA: response regulator, partial [Terriglobia bacterium]|nr:response regulator [Terriglobia bacterium]
MTEEKSDKRETLLMETPATQEAHAGRILIADDQPDILEALDMLLRQNGYRVAMANSPAAILAALGNSAFDALLMDLNYARDTTS